MIRHLLIGTAAVYRFTKAASYKDEGAWALSSTIGIRKSVDNRKVVTSDGKEFYVSTESALIEPSSDVVKLDRLYIDGVIYDVKKVEDVDGMGRETYLTLERMPEGTAAGMGI